MYGTSCRYPGDELGLDLKPNQFYLIVSANSTETIPAGIYTLELHDLVKSGMDEKDTVLYAGVQNRILFVHAAFDQIVQLQRINPRRDGLGAVGADNQIELIGLQIQPQLIPRITAAGSVHMGVLRHPLVAMLLERGRASNRVRG